MAANAPLSDWVERGSNALAAGRWVEARACFEQALECSDSAEAWDGLSWACWWLEDGTAAIQAREQAYRMYKDAGVRVHYAAVLTWHGSWREAGEVLSKAIDDLAATRPPFAYEGMVRLADLRRREGRVEEAERLFMGAESHPMAAVGIAELWLDRNDPGAAILVAERVLRHLPLANKTQRAAALELAVRAKSAAGDTHGAQVHLEELRSVAQAVPTSPLRVVAPADFAASRRPGSTHLRPRRDGDLCADRSRAASRQVIFVSGTSSTSPGRTIPSTLSPVSTHSSLLPTSSVPCVRLVG